MEETKAEEYRRDGFLISTDREKLDIPLVHDYLCNQSYWAGGRSLETVKRSIEKSLCYGVYTEDRQVGFARIVSDFATFSWLCDLFILPEYAGRGLGKWLVECITAHPLLNQPHLFVLLTKDAHELYRNYGGFDTFPEPERWMIRK